MRSCRDRGIFPKVQKGLAIGWKGQWRESVSSQNFTYLYCSLRCSFSPAHLCALRSFRTDCVLRSIGTVIYIALRRIPNVIPDSAVYWLSRVTIKFIIGVRRWFDLIGTWSMNWRLLSTVLYTNCRQIVCVRTCHSISRSKFRVFKSFSSQFDFDFSFDL